MYFFKGELFQNQGGRVIISGHQSSQVMPGAAVLFIHGIVADHENSSGLRSTPCLHETTHVKRSHPLSFSVRLAKTLITEEYTQPAQDQISRT